MLRNRATWRIRLDSILKGKNISLEKILDINEKLYDKEVKELVQWILDKNNLHANEKDIYEQIKIIRNK